VDAVEVAERIRGFVEAMSGLEGAEVCMSRHTIIISNIIKYQCLVCIITIPRATILAGAAFTYLN